MNEGIKRAVRAAVLGATLLTPGGVKADSVAEASSSEQVEIHDDKAQTRLQGAVRFLPHDLQKEFEEDSAIIRIGDVMLRFTDLPIDLQAKTVADLKDDAVNDYLENNRLLPLVEAKRTVQEREYFLSRIQRKEPITASFKIYLQKGTFGGKPLYTISIIGDFAPSISPLQQITWMTTSVPEGAVLQYPEMEVLKRKVE